MKEYFKACAPALIALFAALLQGCAGVHGSPAQTAGVDHGIEIEGARLSAASYMIDFRFRVTDPAKAQTLLDRSHSPCLVHAKTGTRLFVPSSSKTGALRQTAQHGQASAGKRYFVFFANPGRLVRQGDDVSLVMGDAVIASLKVE